MPKLNLDNKVQNVEVLEVKANGDRTLRLEDGSLRSVSATQWNPLQETAVVVPEPVVEPEIEVKDDRKEKPRLAADTYMKVCIVVVLAAILGS